MREWTQWIHRVNILGMNDRNHWGKEKDPKSNLKELGGVQQRQVPRMVRARMDVTVSYPPKIYFDAQNLQPTMKAYVDGMVSPTGRRVKELGFLQDDSDKFFSGPFLEWSGWDTGKPDWFCFRITLTPMEEWSKPDKPAWLK